jgi:hypothetical protein
MPPTRKSIARIDGKIYDDLSNPAFYSQEAERFGGRFELELELGRNCAA